MLVKVKFSTKSTNKNSSNLYVLKDAIVRSTKNSAVWVARLDKNKIMKAVKVLVKTGKM